MSWSARPRAERACSHDGAAGGIGEGVPGWGVRGPRPGTARARGGDRLEDARGGGTGGPRGAERPPAFGGAVGRRTGPRPAALRPPRRAAGGGVLPEARRRAPLVRGWTLA